MNNDDNLARRKRRNLVLGGALLLFVVLVFFITMTRISENTKKAQALRSAQSSVSASSFLDTSLRFL